MASFSPIPPAQCCFAGSKKYRKKSRHHCSNIERGESGGGLSSEGGQRLLAEIVVTGQYANEEFAMKSGFFVHGVFKFYKEKRNLVARTRILFKLCTYGCRIIHTTSLARIVE